MRKESKLKMNDKKAVTLGLKVIVVLIIAIAFVLIFFFWLKDVKKYGEDLGDYTICKNSNLENAKLKLKIDNQVLDERIGNRCKTEYLTVPKDTELHLISKKLAGCWDQYLEGKEELFASEDNTYCAICSVLKFEDKDKELDLLPYLMDNNVPNKRGLSYYTYLTRQVVTDETRKQLENKELKLKLSSIDPEKEWAVIFIEGKNVNPDSKIGEISSMEAGAKGGVFGAIVGTVLLVGVGLCSTVIGCTVGAVFIAAGAAGTGYLLGSDSNPDLDSRVLLWPFQPADEDKGIKASLGALKCDRLEGLK